MDFGTLLNKAQKNDQNPKKEIRYYSTKFEPPKKEQRSKELSANIKKFLARKEEEEKKRQEEARRKKEQLLELRAKDKKATRRVNVMLKRTKSANQSVIQDAVDKDNTAVTLVGASQPDEDDYGYVSQSAADFYNKMMEKYSKMPDEPKFDFTKKKVSTNLRNTKERVKAALEKEKEDTLHPQRRKRKHKDKEQGVDDIDEEKGDPYVEKKEEKAKLKLKPAPVINFSELLKIAAKKQFEPIVIEQKKEKEEERLLTKKQKKELEKERESKERRDQRSSQPGSANKIPKLNEEHKTPHKMNGDKLPKNTETVPPQKMNGEKVPLKNNNKIEGNTKRLDDRNSSSNGFNQPKSITSQSYRPDQKRPISNGHISEKSNSDKMKSINDSKFKPPMKSKDLKPKQFPPNDLKHKQIPQSDLKPKQFPPSDLRHKQFPPKDLKPKQFPPNDMRRNGPPQKRKPLISKGKFYDDDDDEYDSEMDDFIDDGPEGEEDYSKHISEIFGYDKRKYRYADEYEDDDNMESSFAQQMREEVISTKIGIMEDLEDMRNEEEQKKRKAALMKKKKK